LFGPGQAHYKGQLLVGFPGQQCYLLLSYLLLYRQSHHRERLAAVFWGDEPLSTSRKYLSQNLWKLRQFCQTVGISAEEYLCIDKEFVSFTPLSPYCLDVKLFEAPIIEYRNISGAQLTPLEASRLEQAVELYDGDLLEGVYEDWCLGERERLRLLYLETLTKLMLFHKHHQNYQQGLSYGEQLLRLDNTQEQAHQQVIRLYWLMGNRSAALAQYKRCCQILREELDVGPMPDTQRLYEQIIQHHPPPTTHASPSPEVALSSLVRSEEGLRRWAEQSLRQLARLQTTVEETRMELLSLERLIRVALLNSKET
jgi:DNA-binding SARP family transcriptional activator